MSIILQEMNFIQPKYFFSQINHVFSHQAYFKQDPISLLKEISSVISNVNVPALFSDFLEQLDQQFSDSEFRKNHYYIKDKRERTLITSFGVIRFKRRVFIHNQTFKRYYYIDEMLKVRKYQRILDELLFQMIEDLVKEKTSYQKIANRYQVSKTTVYLGLKNLDLSESWCFPDQPIESSNLYVQADEHYVSTQKQKNKKKVMIKQVTLFEEITPLSKNRNQLKNRWIITQHYQETNQQFYTRIQDLIHESYTNQQEIKLILRGDGANWIKNLGDTVGAQFYIDGFHYKQELHRCCPKEYKKNGSLLLTYLKENNIQEFKQILLAMHGVKQIEQLSESLQNSIQYVINHSSSFFKAQALKLPGCSAEGHISHYLASQLTRHPKGYNPQIAHTLAALISMNHNNIPIAHYLKKYKDTTYKPSIEPILLASYYNKNKPSDYEKNYQLNLSDKPTLQKELMRNAH